MYAEPNPHVPPDQGHGEAAEEAPAGALAPPLPAQVAAEGETGCGRGGGPARARAAGRGVFTWYMKYRGGGHLTANWVSVPCGFLEDFPDGHDIILVRQPEAQNWPPEGRRLTRFLRLWAFSSISSLHQPKYTKSLVFGGKMGTRPLLNVPLHGVQVHKDAVRNHERGVQAGGATAEDPAV